MLVTPYAVLIKKTRQTVKQIFNQLFEGLGFNFQHALGIDGLSTPIGTDLGDRVPPEASHGHREGIGTDSPLPLLVALWVIVVVNLNMDGKVMTQTKFLLFQVGTVSIK
jgi:hypothetical protein